MAKCDLSIELDHPDATYVSGEKITGVLRVHVDADVNCKGLEVTSVWRTHGRGNVTSGTAGSMTLFEGQWVAGSHHDYRFELPIAVWPPSYHGHYLNIDHYIDARAKIPWGFDPKASEPFLVRPGCGPEEAKLDKQVIAIKGVLGVVITVFVLGFLVALGVAITVAGIFGLVFLIVPIVGLIWWFFRKFLPRYMLGDVKCDLQQEYVSPGESVTGVLVVQPRRNVKINGISVDLKAQEVCVSGSGSNRTTHRHILSEQSETIQQATTLRAGQTHQFPLHISIPRNAPYTVDLDDNDLNWSASVRIDIPRWPDWIKNLEIAVLPSGKSSPATTDPYDLESIPAEPLGEQAEPEVAVTFAETAHHLWNMREDRHKAETLVGAVAGLTFDLQAIVERRLLYSGADDPHVYEDGYTVWAHYPEPPLPLVLYVPHDLADEFEQIGRDPWHGRGTVVGWDDRHGRLQVKVERRPDAAQH